ncbi:MAG: hypothetical protein PWQ50_572, partial [Methanolobus sp.]|nr:hypothetical protein [Methanolobus sp.]
RQVKRQKEFYNLDAIISVGYRINSVQATQFRIWATQTLKEYIIKGFVMDDERLKQGKQVFGKDYFEELPLPRYRTSSTGQSPGKQPQKSFMIPLMQQNCTWA